MWQILDPKLYSFLKGIIEDEDEKCAVCGRKPAKYTNGKDSLCSEHKRSR
jgi:hypothetical protein